MQTTVRSRTLPALKQQVVILGSLVALIWGLEIADWVSGGALDGLGVAPRSGNALRGILLAPWLHFGFDHVAANTIPLVVLGWFIMLRGMRKFVIVTAAAVLVGGTGTWLIGQSGSVHQGASLIVFGYFGFLIFNGLFERSLQSISLMLIVIMLYGSLIWGVLPLWPDGISWEGHLCGFIGGGIAAWFLTERKRDEDDDDSAEIEINPDKPLEDQITIY